MAESQRVVYRKGEPVIVLPEWVGEIARLEAEAERLRSALGVYADHSRWDDISGLLFCESDDGSPSHGWDVAEAALRGG